MNREELEAYIRNHYATLPDYPWADTPRAAVFRHASNRKWFALVMEVPRDKLGLAGTEKLDIVNFKCDPILDLVPARRDWHFSGVPYEQSQLDHSRAGRQRAGRNDRAAVGREL